MSEVRLAVYDLSRGMARSFSLPLLGVSIDGIWHTGVVCFGREYFFGGGVKSEPYGAFSAQQGLPYWSIEIIGITQKTENDLRNFLASVSHRYTAQTYNLLTHNCNNFSNEVVGFLVGGRSIPSFILDLPSVALSSPGGAMIRNLVENMSSAINGSGSAMDFDIPFGGAGSGSSSSSSVPVSSTGRGTNPVSSQSCSMADIETRPLVSIDSGNITLLAGKILGVSAQFVDKAKLGFIETVQRHLNMSSVPINCQPSAGALQDSDFAELLELLRMAPAQMPSIDMALLFITRLLAARPLVASNALFQPVSELVVGRVLGGQSGFESSSAYVMALAVVTNLLSTEEGISSIVDHIDALLSTSLTLVNDRTCTTEVRQMASSVVFNITLIHISGTPTESLLWGVPQRYFSNAANPAASAPAAAARSSNDSSFLQNSCVEIICSSFEGYGDEPDAAIRRRKMSIVLTILRRIGALCADFLRDMDYTCLLSSLTSTGLEAAIISEILFLAASSSSSSSRWG